MPGRENPCQFQQQAHAGTSVVGSQEDAVWHQVGIVVGGQDHDPVHFPPRAPDDIFHGKVSIGGRSQKVLVIDLQGELAQSLGDVLLGFPYAWRCGRAGTEGDQALHVGQCPVAA